MLHVLAPVLGIYPPSRHNTSIGKPVKMPIFSLSHFRQNFLPCSVRHASAWAYLLVSICVQNGPSQAQGVVGYQQFPFLDQLDSDVTSTIVQFCDAALHFAQTNVEFHKVTYVIDDCLFLAAKLGLNIYCRGRGLTWKCSYPAGMVFTFNEANPTIWEVVRDFEIQWLRIYVLQSLSTPMRRP